MRKRHNKRPRILRVARSKNDAVARRLNIAAGAKYVNKNNDSFLEINAHLNPRKKFLNPILMQIGGKRKRVLDQRML
jgi:hypothetical protein